MVVWLPDRNTATAAISPELVDAWNSFPDMTWVAEASPRFEKHLLSDARCGRGKRVAPWLMRTRVGVRVRVRTFISGGLRSPDNSLALVNERDKCSRKSSFGFAIFTSIGR